MKQINDVTRLADCVGYIEALFKTAYTMKDALDDCDESFLLYSHVKTSDFECLCDSLPILVTMAEKLKSEVLKSRFPNIGGTN